jgi:hypothetical protein
MLRVLQLSFHGTGGKMQIRTKYLPVVATTLCIPAQGAEARGRIKRKCGQLVNSLAFVTPHAMVRVVAKFALIAVALIGVLTSFGASSAVARDHWFYYPRREGIRLDWCFKLGRDCGYKAAGEFCRHMGYDRRLSG